ncbi:hypothetical protein ACFY12_08130 [Streptomyces sp. NPDC001339]|uniref:hypothetical protein n=1 Tax=Streptomyces sp. NPDC001339 TaxID=3364563 RepID=UPI0036C4C322
MRKFSVLNSLQQSQGNHPKNFIVMVAIAASTTLAGCSSVTDSGKEPAYTPEVRQISEARKEAKDISSNLFDAIGLQGRISQPGPGVSQCGDKGPAKFYTIHHPWSLSGVSVEDMKQAMARLKENLPKNDWKIVSYGPDKSPSKSLELIADSTKRKFSVNIRLLDRTQRASSNAPSMIYVDLTSACFQVPEGKTVDEY